MTHAKYPRRSVASLVFSFIFTASFVHTAVADTANLPDQRTRGIQAIQKMTGCYLVDYSYTETKVLIENHPREERVYDVNLNKSIKEWIYAEALSPNHVRLQHVLFGVDLNGKIMAGSELRHQAEDWEFNAPFLYDFVGPER